MTASWRFWRSQRRGGWCVLSHSAGQPPPAWIDRGGGEQGEQEPVSTPAERPSGLSHDDARDYDAETDPLNSQPDSAARPCRRRSSSTRPLARPAAKRTTLQAARPVVTAISAVVTATATAETRRRRMRADAGAATAASSAPTR